MKYYSFQVNFLTYDFSLPTTFNMCIWPLFKSLHIRIYTELVSTKYTLLLLEVKFRTIFNNET